MHFLSIILRNLWRRPVRSFLTATGVAVAVATLIALVGTSQGVERAWSESMAGKGVHMLGYRKNSVDILSSMVDQAIVDQITGIAGVKAVAGEIADLVKIETGAVVLSGWPIDGFLWESLRIQKGRRPGTNDPNGALLGQRLAERWEVGVGDRIPLLETEVEVTGIFQQASVLNESAVIISLPLAQKLLGKEGKVTVINLRLIQPGDRLATEAIRARLDELYPGLSFLETKDVTEASQIIGLLKKMNWSISLIAMLMGVFFIMNTLLMSVNERIREIGILAALGWRKMRIMAMIMLEGLLLAAMGGTTGLLVGLAGLYQLASIKQMEGFIDPEVSFSFMLEVFLAATALGVLGSLYPAWRTSRLRAVEALKHE